MSDFKNYKILLLLMLFAFAGKDAWAYKGTWFNFRASLSKTGEGKVYGDFESKSKAMNHSYENVPVRHRCDDTDGASETNDTYSPNDIDLHLWAEASDGWEFLEWRDNNGNKLTTSMPCDASGNATSASTKYGYAIVRNFKSKNVCAVNCGSSDKATSGSSHLNQHNTTYSYNYNTRVDAYYVAVFNKLEKDPIVAAEAIDETLGEATFFPADNQVGDIVTIATYPKGPKDKGYENKFLGWQYNGDYLRDDQGKIIRDNPYTFEVTNDNGGVYYAVYESGYVFHRLRNYVTQDYFAATGDNVTGNGVTALPNALAQNFNMQNDVTVNAGSIYEINTSKNTDASGRIVYDLAVQNKHTKDYYELPSIYIRINQNADKNAWNFSTSTDDGQGTRLRVNEQGVQSVSNVLDERSLWYIEPMDKDLETKENYFSLDPEKLVQVGDKYYTTLRTSWNILFNPEQMTPYVVTSVDETEGTFEMAPITGNIIPAGTPVIIKTRSNVIEENRMVPTKTAAASGAVPAGNLLKYSEKYFPNQTVATNANYKQLMVNANGELAFGGNALSTVNGNEAYLQVSSEVALKPDYKEVTLAELVKDGEVGQKYIVTDLTAMIPFDGDRQFLCKDNNGFAEKDDYSKRPEGVEADKWIDYMQQQTDLKVPETYDQSNWIALRLPKDGKFDINMGRAQLSNVKGRLLNKVNPELLLDVMPTYQETGTGDPMPVNTFVAASFAGTNRQQGTNDKWYFFVQPKPMELATVEWAQWNGTMFTAPIHDENHPHWNEAGLQGAFEYDDSYAVTKPDKLNERHIYRMGRAIAKLKSGISEPAGAPRRAEGTAVKYVVYPLSLEQTSKTGDNDIITEVTHVVGREVTAVDYYNLAGQRSERPWQGINIVVTRYSDGTTQASKVLR